MDLGFGEALLIFGLLLAVTAALSGLIRGTVLSASVLSIVLGIVLAELEVVHIDVGDENIVHLIELALILTLVSDGLLVDRELLGRHWGPPARALVIAMPLTLLALALGAKLLFAEFSWAEAFLLGAVLLRDRPGGDLLGGLLRSGAGLDPPHAQPGIGAERRPRAAVRALLSGARGAGG